MNPPLSVTVVIPLYNKARHIARALESVRSQTHPPDEIIVVDDASSDGGARIVGSFPEVRLLARDAFGAGGYAARNLGIEHARTDWVAFLDADDEWHPKHLTKALDLIDRMPGLTMVCAAYIERAGGAARPDPYTLRWPARKEQVLDFRHLLQLWVELGTCPIWTSATLVRREIIGQVGGFPAGRCVRGGDKDLWLRVARIGDVGLLPEVGATYYRDADNMVTARPHTNLAHCIEPTVSKMKRDVPRLEGRLLSAVLDVETFRYAMNTAKQTQLSRNAWRPLRFWRSPLKYLMLSLLSSAFGRLAARIALWLRHGWRKWRA